MNGSFYSVVEIQISMELGNKLTTALMDSVTLKKLRS